MYAIKYMLSLFKRKLLIGDIAELKAKQKEEKQIEGADSSTNYEDPVILKMKLAYGTILIVSLSL